MRETKHKQDGKAHDVVFISNRFVFRNKKTFFFDFFFLVFGFSLLPEKFDKNQQKPKTKMWTLNVWL